MIHFIDTNVPMYAVGAAHPLKKPCLAILEAVATGALTAATDTEVLQEILHRYTALGQRSRAAEVARLFLQVVPEALPITKDTFLLAIDLHLSYTAIQARDALHAAVMQQHGIERIISADRHFDGLPGITRLDPSNWLA
jgi:predicted nucleic acid-binding protein